MYSIRKINFLKDYEELRLIEFLKNIDYTFDPLNRWHFLVHQSTLPKFLENWDFKNLERTKNKIVFLN